MKRFIFAAGLLVLVLGFNSYCLFSVTEIKNEVFSKLDELYTFALTETDIRTSEKADEFTEYWIETQHILCRMVRHDLLDETTVAVSRLSPLAKFGEKGEFCAEINRCRILIEEIWDSELPLPRNIF